MRHFDKRKWARRRSFRDLVRHYRAAYIARHRPLSKTELAIAMGKRKAHAQLVLESGALPSYLDGDRYKVLPANFERFMGATDNSALPELDPRMRHKHREPPAPLPAAKVSDDPEIRELFL